MTVKKTADTMTKSLTAMAAAFDVIPEQAYKYFVSVTPKRSGNARKKTTLKSGESIQANYPYAVPLNSGSSKQAPDGMTKPTLEYIKRLGDKAIRK
jgi:hypothetical protein